MPWKGPTGDQTFERTDGARSGPNTWQQAKAADVDIVADDHDTHDEDIAVGLSQALRKDGGNTAAADIPMGGNRLTDIGDAEARNQALTLGQGQDNKHQYIPTVTGTADVITLTSASGLAITAYAAGQVFYFRAASSNTGSVTVNIDGVGAKTVKRFDGSTDLMTDDIRAGSVVQIKYDGTNFQLDGASQSAASSDILARVLPTGATIFWGLDTIPAGWLKAEGQAVTKSSYPELDAVYQADGYPYGASSAVLGAGTMNLPPAAGRFIRVVDGTTGIDPDASSRTDRGDGAIGDNVGTLQDDDVERHNHVLTDPGHKHISGSGADIPGGFGGGFPVGDDVVGDTTIDTTGITLADFPITGGNETRPKNIYQYLIVLANPTAAAASSVGLFGLPYNFAAETDDTDPGSGNLRLSHTDLTSVTSIYLDNLEANAADVSAFIDTWDDSGSTIKGTIKLSKVGAPSNFAIYNVTGAVTDGTGYRKVAVAHVDSNGSFAASEPVSLEFVRSGDLGSSGDVGFPFTFDSATDTAADPGVGDVRLNNADLSSVIEIAISDQTTEIGNPDISPYILTWDDSASTVRGAVTIQKASARENFATYHITGASTDEAGWVRLAVTYVNSAGSFANTDNLHVSFVRTGDPGTAGSIGPSGVGGFDFNWNTATSGDPGAGKIRINAGVTEIAFNDVDGDAVNVEAYLQALDNSTSAAKAHIYIIDTANKANRRTLRLDSVFADQTGYWTATVTSIDSAGTLANDADVAVIILPTGDKGETGNTGPAGPATSVDDTVRVATTADGTLATDFENGDTIDGVVLATNDLLLIKDQAAAAENGVYVVQSSGAPSRETDYDTFDEHPGKLITVQEGAANADSIWLCTSDLGGTLGVTAIDWALRFGSATETVEGLVELATNAETQTGTDTARAVTPAGLASLTATESRDGLVELATAAEVATGTDTARATTPAGIAAHYSPIIRQVNAQTGTTYTFVLTDRGKLITGTNASAITWTVPPNASVAFEVGTQIDLAQEGAGQITLAQGVGVTINSKDSNMKLTGQYSAGTLVKTSTDVWMLFGDLVA